MKTLIVSSFVFMMAIAATSFAITVTPRGHLIDMTSQLSSTTVYMDFVENGQLNILIPPSENVSVKQVEASAHCAFVGMSKSQLATEISFVMPPPMSQYEVGNTCVYKVTDNGQSANITFAY